MARRNKKVKTRRTLEQVMYGVGLVGGFCAVYYALGLKIGMPNPLHRGKTREKFFRPWKKLNEENSN